MKISLFVVVLLYGLLGIKSSGHCQALTTNDSNRFYFIGGGLTTGYLIPDGTSLPTISERSPFTLHLDFSMLKNEKAVWDYANCYIRNGFSLSYVDYGNNQILGKAVNLVIFTEPYLLCSSRWRITLRSGAGFSFLNKIYDATTNPENIYVSKHVSHIIMLNPTIYYNLSSRLSMQTSVQLSHISNGGIQWPNWGLNNLEIGIGIEYNLQPQELKKREITPLTDRSWKVISHAFAGMHNINPTATSPQEKRPVAGLNIGIVKPLGKVSSLGVGGEFYYDGASSVLEVQSGQQQNPIIGSLSIQHYFFLGKIAFGQQMAYYVTPNHPNIDTNFYQRYYLEYKLPGPWYVGVSLRAHGDISDYLTLSTGFIL